MLATCSENVLQEQSKKRSSNVLFCCLQIESRSSYLSESSLQLVLNNAESSNRKVTYKLCV